MKKTLSIFCFLICLIATSCYKNEIEDLNNRLESLEKLDSNRIATIQQQIAGINQTLADLDEADEDLNKFLNNLKKTATSLETEILRINEEIATIDANEKTVALALENLRNDMTDQLARIQTNIEILEEQLTEDLNEKAEELRKYISNGLQDYEDWAEATFATLEQSQGLATTISGIENTIINLREEMERGDKALQADIDELREELDGVDGKISSAISEVTTAYTEAIATAKNQIEYYYKEDIQKAIDVLEEEIKSWVNERLSNYYDIAEVDAKLQLIENAHSEDVSELNEKVSKVKSDLKTEYEKAISQAITTNNGLIDEKIAKAISDINVTIATEISDLNKKISNLEARIFSIEGKVNSLEEQMESINATLEVLDGIDYDLDSYLQQLQEAANKLQSNLNQTNQDIEKLRNEIIAGGGSGSAAELELLRQEIENELTNINTAIALLQERDSKLQSEINNLRNELGSMTDWAEGTFVTLEAYYNTTDLVAQIKQDVETLKTSLPALESRLNEKISNDIAKAVSNLESSLANKVTELTNGYLDAVADAKSEITEAYTDALEDGLYTLENSIKDWVNKQLSNYCTVANFNAGIEALKTEFNNKLDNQKTYLVSLINALDSDLSSQIEENAEEIETLTSGISRLDKDLSNKATQISNNANAISQNASEIAKNAKNIADNSSSIEDNEASINENKELIDANTELINTNKSLFDSFKADTESDIADALENIIENADAIADNADLIAQNATAISNNAAAIAQNAADIKALEEALEEAKTTIKEEYENAIETAITELDGSLRGEISTQIAAVNTLINTTVSELNSSISKIDTRVKTLEDAVQDIRIAIYGINDRLDEHDAQIEALIGRIQSVTYIPDYSDGKATMTYTNSSGKITAGTATLRYEVHPAAMADELVKVWEDALKVEVVYTMTRAAGDFVTLDIQSVTAKNGILTIVVSGDKLSDEYFRSEISANIRLEIENGYSYISSDFTNMIPWTTNVVYIPDANFKNYLVRNFDENGDGEISLDEAETITAISNPAPLSQIKSMAGIEYFTNLETLDISYNRVTSLDLSANTKLKDVNVSNNKLTSLILPASVENVNASDNQITSLDVSTATGLKTLNVENNNIATLFVDKNKDLTSLNCSKNSLASLDVSKLIWLTELSCAENSIASLYLAKNTQLTSLDCHNNNLTQLDLTKNTLLENVDCSENSLTTLYVVGSKMKTFDCSENNLTALNVLQMTDLETLDCAGNALTQLDVTTCVDLKQMDCSNNNLQSLNISTNTMLTTLDCSDNANLERIWVRDDVQGGSATITKDDHTLIFINSGNLIIPDAALKSYLVNNYDLDNDGEISVEESYNITMVNCSNQGVKDLTGLEYCSELVTLTCSNNDIKTISLPNLTKLRTVTCDGNPIEKLNFDNCTALQYLNLQGVTTNAISGTTISINSYSQATTFDISVKGTPFTTFKFRNDADLTDIAFLGEFTTVDLYGNSILEGIDVSTLTDLQSLDVQKCKLQTLDVTNNRELTMLAFSDNEISSIDLSNNTALDKLYCNDNKLSKINVTNNTALKEFDIANNKLSALNIRNNTVLKYLKVSDNTNLSMVDVAYNTALEVLLACEIAITDIDLTNNTALKGVSLLSPNLTSVIGKPSTAGEGIESYEKTPYVSGEMMSLIEYRSKLSNCKSWGSNYGTGWNLGNRANMRNISTKWSDLNNILKLYNLTKLGNSSYYYWASEGGVEISANSYSEVSLPSSSSYNARAILTY